MEFPVFWFVKIITPMLEKMPNDFVLRFNNFRPYGIASIHETGACQHCHTKTIINFAFSNKLVV